VTSTVESAPKAGSREWLGLAVLALTAMLISFDLFVLLLAMPHLSADLHADSVEQLWIMDIYGFLVGGFLITMGGVGDRIGRRRLLLIGAAGFSAASVLAAYSVSPEMLIAARALLGLFGATLVPSTLALIGNMFHDPRQRGLAIGIWASFFTVGAVVGPVLGGILLAAFWWGSVFLLGLPIMVLLLVFGRALLPEYRDRAAGRLDVVSAVMSVAAILLFIYGVKELAKAGWAPVPVAATLLGLVVGVLFVRRQRRLAHPLLDLGLFGDRDFSLGMTGLFAYSLFTGAVLLLMSQYFQSVAGLDSLQAGLALVPGMLVSSVSSTLSPILARRIRPALLIGIGLLVVVGALVAFAFAGPDSPGLLIIAFAVWCAGGAPLQALGIGLILGAAPPEKMGAASALPQVGNEIGSALGFALLGTVATVVYRAGMAGAVPPGVPAEAADAARENIAGAAAASAHLPERLGAALLAPAREAFTTGLHTVSVLSAAALALVAVLVLARLRHIPPLGNEEAGPEPAADDAGAAVERSEAA
jgi:DHA2 family multidrug resistance protein-like MFS transporter